MSDVPSRHYDRGYFVQAVVSKGVMVTFWLYRLESVSITPASAVLYETKHSEPIAKQRLLWGPRGRSKSSELPPELGIKCAVVETDSQLRDTLESLIRSFGYSRQEARGRTLSWLGKLDIESN